MGFFGHGREYKSRISEIETGIERLKGLDSHSDEYGTLFNELKGKIGELKQKDRKIYSDKLGL